MAYPETLSELTNYPKALSHAESGGGGFSLKSISFENTTENEVAIHPCINAEGKYIDPIDPLSGDYVKVAAGKTVAVYYAEPSADSEWKMYADSMVEIALQTTASGIGVEGTEVTITAEAPDGATVTVVGSGNVQQS